MNYEREVALAKQVAEEAGRIAQDIRKNGLTPEEKADDSPVTAADRACEKLIVDTLQREFPDDGVLGEEGANRAGSSGRKWIIDPIDGTKDFIRGIPLWSVLIGLEDRGEVVAGVACCPGQRLLVSASKGNGTWVNGARVRVSDKSTPTQAILAFNGFNKCGITENPGLLKWVRKFWAVRGLGGSVDAILLASGSADAWIEPDAKPWDLAPLKIFVEEAGGCFGAIDGSTSIYAGSGWGCVPGLRGYLSELLEGGNRLSA